MAAVTFESRSSNGAYANGRSLSRLHHLLPRAIRPTVGKRVMNIGVARTNGQPIGWWEAWLRSSFDVLFAMLGMVASFVAVTAVSDEEYYGVGLLQRTQNLHALQPWWLGWTEVASEIWVWSEVVVMLFNRQRRALHNFIAGTVVTAEERILHAQVHTT